jgi:hypothetical protein
MITVHFPPDQKASKVPYMIGEVHRAAGGMIADGVVFPSHAFHSKC